MESASILRTEDVRERGRIIVRRFTDGLTGTDVLERQVQMAKIQEAADEREIEHRRMMHLYGGTPDAKPSCAYPKKSTHS